MKKALIVVILLTILVGVVGAAMFSPKKNNKQEEEEIFAETATITNIFTGEATKVLTDKVKTPVRKVTFIVIHNNEALLIDGIPPEYEEAGLCFLILGEFTKEEMVFKLPPMKVKDKFKILNGKILIDILNIVNNNPFESRYTEEHVFNEGDYRLTGIHGLYMILSGVTTEMLVTRDYIPLTE